MKDVLLSEGSEPRTDAMLPFKSVRARNILSFGDTGIQINLEPINVLIGPNGAGKSNLIELFSLLKSAPGDLAREIREGGGVQDWLWKGATPEPTGALEAIVDGVASGRDLRFSLSFTAIRNRLQVVDERVENEVPDVGHTKPYFYFGYENGRPMINVGPDGDSGARGHRELRRETIDPEQSVLSQRKDPDLYPEITHVAELFSRISTYRDWRLGRYTPPRLPQPVDAPNDVLREDASNLGLVVNRIKSNPATRNALDEYMSEFLPDYEYVETLIEGGTVQIFISEKGRLIPATRLSDGTLRWLALLAVLLNPTPPPLVCIEEPELDLHPDVIPVLGQLLRAAATRTQVVVTTHSDDLASEFSDAPTAVIVCERRAGESHFARLEAEQLEPWLAKYRLGQLRQMGEIGGNRY